MKENHQITKLKEEKNREELENTQKISNKSNNYIPINNLKYASDTTLMAESKGELKKFLMKRE